MLSLSLIKIRAKLSNFNIAKMHQSYYVSFFRDKIDLYIPLEGLLYPGVVERFNYVTEF
jgi:hypothetical protein